jgi:hypothetical protein
MINAKLQMENVKHILQATTKPTAVGEISKKKGDKT